MVCVLVLTFYLVVYFSYVCDECEWRSRFEDQWDPTYGKALLDVLVAVVGLRINGILPTVKHCWMCW